MTVTESAFEACVDEHLVDGDIIRPGDLRIIKLETGVQYTGGSRDVVLVITEDLNAELGIVVWRCLRNQKFVNISTGFLTLYSKLINRLGE